MNLQHRQGQKVDTTQEDRQKSEPLEFQTAEELIRHDAAQIAIPESIAGRIAESAGGAAPSPWWKRLFQG